MAKEMGDLLQRALRHRYHADYTTFVFEPSFVRFGRMRIRSVEQGLKEIYESLLRIRRLAEETNNQELLSILNEQEEILLVHD
ncbi:MAG: hypothetical protein AAB529_01365 [Patescibacteria group bacterium]